MISQQSLQQSQFSNLAEALETVEGVDVRQSTGKTGGLNISMRGLPSEYTLIKNVLGLALRGSRYSELPFRVTKGAM